VADYCRNIPLEQRISSIRDGDVTHHGTPVRSRRLTVQPRKKTDVPDDIVNWLRKKQQELEEFWWPNEDPPLTQYGKAADEIERLRQVIAKQNGDMAHELLRNQQLCTDLNETQELLARCYTLAVGHGPNFDVFDDWEEAVSAYERETYRGNT